MKLLITGAAGFIGYHLTQRLLCAPKDGDSGTVYDIVYIDNVNDYYDVELKNARLAELQKTSTNSTISPNSSKKKARFIKMDITNAAAINELFETQKFDIVIHLAAQAGVRYSLVNPTAYIESNIQGFLNILEACRLQNVAHLIYASSSSVYGNQEKQPFSETDSCANPASLYATSKIADELMAKTYFNLYRLNSTGLRFFTVYGPFGRPDMAPFIFTKSILEGKPLTVFNHGNMQRDFTYIDDIIAGIVSVIDKNKKNATIYNIGNGKPVALMDFIRELENALGKKAHINFLPMQQGDVSATWADCSALEKECGYKSATSIQAGIKKFTDWYKDFYK
ncbi:MAG: NAD-dependent epimerase [Treponemataceae bacterium]|nr:MAG: NAD-dependent epimerase [Treponemataceae bacterium]